MTALQPLWSARGSAATIARSPEDRQAGSGNAHVPGRDEAPAARTLVEIFASTAAKWPRRPALQDATRSLSYRQLQADAERLARRLRRAGVGRGDRVGIRVPGSTTDLYVAVLGVLFAGAAYVPVDSADPEGRAELV